MKLSKATKNGNMEKLGQLKIIGNPTQYHEQGQTCCFSIFCVIKSSVRSIGLIAGEANDKFQIKPGRSLLARRGVVPIKASAPLVSGVEVSFCSALQTLNEGLNVFGETLQCIALLANLVDVSSECFLQIM